MSAAQSQLVGFPYFSDQIAFGISANSVYTPAALLAAWVDVGWRVRRSEGVLQGRQYELGQQQPGQGTWTLRNDDEALNPSNPSSPYYPNVKPYRPARTVTAYPQAGNILNDLNALWPDAPVSSEDATFEGGTIGHWFPAGAAAIPTLSNDGTHHKSGTKALKMLFAGTPGSFAGAYLAVPVIPGVSTTISVPVFMNAAGLTQAQLAVAGLGFGGVTTTVGSFRTITQTFVPTTPVVTFAVIFTGAAGAAWIDEVQVQFGPATAFTSTGPGFDVDWQGYIERFPESWEMRGFRGVTVAPLIDAFAFLPRTELKDVATQESLADDPTGFWPLDDPAGSLVAAQKAPHGTQPNLTVVSLGTPSSADTLTFGTNASPTVDAGTCATWVNDGGVSTPALRATGLTGMSSATGFSLELWFRSSNNTASFGLVYITDSRYVLNIDPIAFINLTYRPTPSSSATTTLQSPIGPFTNTGIWHQLVLTESNNGTTTTCRLYLDGVQVDTSTFAATSCTNPTSLLIGSDYVGAFTPWYGDACRVQTYDSTLSAVRVAAHYTAAKTGFSGELSGARYARLLSYATGTLPASIDAGMTPMGPASGLAGQQLMQALTEVVTAEGGNHNMARNGTLVFSGRADRYLTHTAAFTFGEFELAYLDDITFDSAPTFILNDIAITGSSGIPQLAADQDSIDDYFDSTYPLSVNVLWDTEAKDIATWTLQQYKDPHARLGGISFDPTGDPALWPVALMIEQGDRVTVKRRTSAGLTMNSDYWVEAISRTRGPGVYTLTLQLSPVWTTNVWQLGDATYGVLGTSTILAR